MSRSKLIYIPLMLLFLTVMSVLVIHYSRLPDRHRLAFREANLPFGYTTKVMSVSPSAEAAGVKVGDRIHNMNGRELKTPIDLLNEIKNLQPDAAVPLVLARDTDSGQELVETTVTTVPATRNARTYASYITGFLYTYAIPTLAILLAFWVLFLRPLDPLAWILMVVLLGMSSIAFELYPPDTFIGAYKTIVYGSWALGMLLFGIYFPDRWTGDRRFPWLKWILIVPLGFQIIITVLSRLEPLLGFNPVDSFRPLANAYSYIGFYVNMIAIGSFFALLGYKSGTTDNPDSRRRLRLLVWGTSIGMTPTFLVIVYQAVTRAGGSFFEVVPFWVAVITLLLLNLFPLTMAYVIVVYRAMDVRVVIRQGLQYGLAKNGVRVLQFLLLIAIIAGTLLIIRNYSENISVQIAFVVGGLALIPLIDTVAKRLRVWIDKKFFREAYDAEQILTDLSDDVRMMVETRPLLETVTSKISESLHVPQVTLLLKNGANFIPAYALGYDTPPVASLSDDTRSMQKLRKNQHIVLYDDMTEVTSVPTVSLNEREQLRELNSQILLPLAAKNELSGIISLSPKMSEEPYTASDIRLLKSVASQTGLALENSRLAEAFAKEAAQKERLNAEVEIAREVQERLFPQELPPVKGLDYYGSCRPALGVGGDYYDFIELPDGKFGIAIGDVSGKGIGASLMMASLQASLRGQAIHSGDDLASMMSHVNRLVYETSTTNRYATFFYAQFDPTTRKLSYVNAGHNPPFLIREGGSVETLEIGGPVIGMLPPMIVSYEMGTVELHDGDMLVGFTDGISEAMNPSEEEWGEDAMLQELKLIIDKPAVEILPHIVAAADRFANGAKQHDDMTMVIVRLLISIRLN